MYEVGKLSHRAFSTAEEGCCLIGTCYEPRDAKLRIMTGPKRHWRRFTTTPKFSFALGALWVVLAAFQWFSVATSKAWGGVPEGVILAFVMTLLAVVYLVSAVRLHRKQSKERDL
jgi:predicted small integral membrane protein